MSGRLRHKIDYFLYKQQFYSPTVRRLLNSQLCLVLLAVFTGLIFLPLSLWPAAFACGAALALFNFWHIARFASVNVEKKFSALMGGKYFLLFNLRLLITGLVLVGLIVYCMMPVLPLVAGLSSAPCIVLFWSISKITSKYAREV